MIECCNKIINYTNGLSYEQFIEDSKTLDAVIRNFEIIGEVTVRLPEEFRNLHPEIEWQKIRGLRNRVIHHYFGIDYSILWEIITQYIPDLQARLPGMKA
jgi:uncharacterized protein with HEPN domain